MEDIRFSDIPYELFDAVTRQLSNYTVAFFRIEETRSDEDAVLLGSGTLVEMDGVYGILTAHHVVETLPKKGDVGFLLFSDLHRYTMKADFLKRIKIARGFVETDGPDLAVIILPPANLGQIKALKSFYNLGLKRDQILSTPLENDRGLWFLCGTPNELTGEDTPTKEFGRVKVFWGVGVPGRVSQGYWVGAYDYLEFEVQYGAKSELPTSFKGVSGGGLWQVPLISLPNGKVAAKELILSGVAFYESAIMNNVRSIKCHGRHSLYKSALDTLTQHRSSQLGGSGS